MKNEDKEILFIQIRPDQIEHESPESKVNSAFVDFVEINDELFVGDYLTIIGLVKMFRILLVVAWLCFSFGIVCM